MGSLLSPIIADMILQDLENIALKSLPFRLPFYYRYVDDTIFTVPQHTLELILHTFNSLHQRLQFTMEVEDNNKISFLDVTLIKEDGGIIFDL